MAGVQLSQRDLDHINSSRKRPSSAESWKDKEAKFLKNSGLPYLARDGSLKPDKVPPSGVKVCSCSKLGCQLNVITPQRQTTIFMEFWGSASHDLQSAILLGGIRTSAPAATSRPLGVSNRQSTNLYFLSDANGRYENVCQKTFLNVYQVSEKRIRGVLKKLKSGEIAPVDKRGLHLNRPKRYSDEAKRMVREHIESFPTTISHYSRQSLQNPEQLYISQDLTIAKMFRMFHELMGDEVEKLESLYRRTFRELGIKIGIPRSDTCTTCDKHFLQMRSTPNGPLLEKIENDLMEHHMQSEIGYADLQNDILQSRTDPNYVVLCVDLQQVFQSPVLSNSAFYYQRKFNSYNLGIYEASTEKTTMCYWLQTEAKRGSTEIASCVLEFIRSNFRRGPNMRKLVIWSDRCVGQNNNWLMLALYKYFVAMDYFVEVNQRFMVSGHSFLPCDRQFAKIEKRKLRSVISHPEDWINVILDAQPTMPFRIQRMTQDKFVSFNDLLSLTPKPKDLKITDIQWARYSRQNPNEFQTKETFDTRWRSFRLQSNAQVRGITFRKAYNQLLPLDPLKLKDLKEMIPFLPSSCHQYYKSLN